MIEKACIWCGRIYTINTRGYKGICRSCIKRSDSMFLVGDKVQIIDSMAKEWIGRKAVIRKVLNYPNEPIRYQLDIGGGDWEGSCLEKI